MIIKRIFDLIFSVVGIIILVPLLLLIALWIKLDSKGPIIFVQKRVGRYNKDFQIYKFRTMKTNSSNRSLLILGIKDVRITKAGHFLRKHKLDELPQLFNVINNSMSLVGPRPEVREYVNYYSSDQLNVLDVKPGITDVASLAFYNEGEILGEKLNSEEHYIQEIMPQKIQLSLAYIQDRTLLRDGHIIFKTVLRIFK